MDPTFRTRAVILGWTEVDARSSEWIVETADFRSARGLRSRRRVLAFVQVRSNFRIEWSSLRWHDAVTIELSDLVDTRDLSASPVERIVLKQFSQVGSQSDRGSVPNEALADVANVNCLLRTV